MGRNNTRAAKSIAKMYEQLGLPQDDIFHKTKLLLSIYRDVVWATLSDCRCVNAEINYYGDDLNDALIYLEEFAPDIERSEFEHRVCNLFENKWMIDLIDKAMRKVYDYYNNGRLYHEILSKSYLTAFRYTESELLEILNLERSTFYDRKKEAVMLLGIALWGYAIPAFRGIFDADPQGDLTTCLGWQDTDSLPQTLSNKLSAVMREEQQDPFSGILSHEEKVDLVPSNLDLSALEMSLVTAMSRESVMKNYLSQVKDRYDYVLIDTEPAKDESFAFSRFTGAPYFNPRL